MPIPVILDTDIGTDVDDTWALLQLLASPELDLRLIVTTGGDTRYRAALTAKLLTVAGRTDVPIALGSGGAAYGEFQRRWLGSFSLADYPGPVYDNQLDAYRTLAESASDLTVISIGPATSVARLAAEAPELVERCRFVGMQGSVALGYGGSPPPVPEANVKSDPAALRHVLAAPWRDILLTPLDTCGLVTLDGERYVRIWSHPGATLAALRENYQAWAADVSWHATPLEEVPHRSSTLFDTVAVYLAYDERWVRVESHPLAVTDDGMTVIDEAGPRVRLALAWEDLEAFEDDLVERLCSG